MLGEKHRGAQFYGAEDDEDFRWYGYRFANASKPVSHVVAFSNLKDSELRLKRPEFLKRLIDRVRELALEYPD